MSKTCLSCSQTIRGRSDKKFCDDYCRNNYNNQQKSKSGQNSYVRHITSTLLKNRRIMEALLPPEEETTRASRDKLLLLGFEFRYSTHHYTTKSGKTYYYCFDYGYLPLSEGWNLIVKRKDL